MSLPISARLQQETERHMSLLEKLGGKLMDTMDTDVCRDALGVPVSATPSRDWARCFSRYQTGMKDLLTEERERTKLRLFLEKDGSARALTDEEYEAEMKTLAIEALRELPPGELEAELKRRGLVVEVPVEREDDDA